MSSLRVARPHQDWVVEGVVMEVGWASQAAPRAVEAATAAVKEAGLVVAVLMVARVEEVMVAAATELQSSPKP